MNKFKKIYYTKNILHFHEDFTEKEILFSLFQLLSDTLI